MPATFSFTAANGVPFLCRLVNQGDPYGADFCLTHHDPIPAVEFYDARYPFCHEFVGTKEEAIAAGAPVLGQFVTRYMVSTLMDHRLHPTAGLCLNGGIPAWCVDANSMAKVNAWMDQLTQPHVSHVIKAIASKTWDGMERIERLYGA